MGFDIAMIIAELSQTPIHTTFPLENMQGPVYMEVGDPR